MFTIANGRDHLYQWDSNVKLTVDDPNHEIFAAHFTSRFSTEVLTVQVEHTETGATVTVPNILLLRSFDIVVYAYCAEETCTKAVDVIKVKARPKPNDYVYEETEVLTWKSLDDRLRKVEETGGVNVTGAKVGQTIVVKAVDEDGKPTEWAPVNFPEKKRELLLDITATNPVGNGKKFYHYLTDEEKNKIVALFDANVEVEVEVIYSAYMTEYVATLSNASKVVSGLTLAMASYDANFNGYNAIAMNESSITITSAYATLVGARIYRIT